jgi:hypothetical protein
MAASKELWSVYEKPFCGICDTHFPCFCVEISDSGQVFFSSTEKSSKKRKKRRKRKKRLRSTRNNDTPDKPQRSLSASDATKKVIFPGRQLSNEFLSAQIETLRITGQTTVNLVEKLLVMVTNLTAEVTQLRNDKAVLQIQLCELENLLFTKSCHMEAASGTSSSQPGLMSYKDALASNQHQQVRNVNISKSPKNLISTNQKSKTVNAVAEVLAAKKWTSLVSTLTGNPADYYYYYYYYYYHHHHHHHPHLISHFSALAGKYSPILGFSHQQD